MNAVVDPLFIPHPGWRPSPRTLRVVTNDAGLPDERDAHRARSTVRTRVLAMAPLEHQPHPSRRKALTKREPGVLWSLDQPSGLAVALRARDFSTVKAAIRDLQTLLARTPDLMIVHTTEQAEGRHGWWIVLDNDIVLVSAYPAKPSTAERDALRVIASMERLAEMFPLPRRRR